MENWTEFYLGTDTNETLTIIEDALCYHFEFKVENHKLYFREMSN